MDISSYQSLSIAKELFDSLNILEEFNPRIFYDKSYVSFLRGKSYKEQWELHMSKYWFHFLLDDGSLFIFDKDSYRYLMPPIKTPTKDEFLHSEFGEDWHEFTPREQQEYLSSADFTVDYQSYVESVSTFSAYTPIRYDASLVESDYCKFTHPAFHLHIGFENSSRIPVKFKMTPLSFSLFVLSTFYPKLWLGGIQSNLISDEILKKVKVELDSIPQINKELWCNEYEEGRFYLA